MALVRSQSGNDSDAATRPRIRVLAEGEAHPKIRRLQWRQALPVLPTCGSGPVAWLINRDRKGKKLAT